MAFKYRERSPDVIDRRAEQKGGDFEGYLDEAFKMYTMKSGENALRILPPTWDDPDHYGMDLWLHYRVGPEGASVVCPNKTENPATKEKGARCPICIAAAKADRDGDEELAKELKARKRVLVWVLDMKDEDRGPQLWAMPWTVDRDINKVCKDRHTGQHYIIDHPDEGYTVYIDKDGEQRNTKYSGIQLARHPSSVATEVLDYIEAAPAPFCIVWRDYDQLAKMFDGGEPPPRREDRRDDRDDRRDDRPAARERDREPERPAAREREPERDRERDRPAAREAAPAPRERFRPPAQEDKRAPDRSADYPDEKERKANMDRNRDVDDSPLPDKERPAYQDRGGGASAADRAAALRAKFGAGKK